MATFNVRGLKGKEDGTHTDKMRNLLAWAYKNSLDVLFIQEHNGNRDKVSEWKAMCERSGYSIVHGLHNDTTGSGRGAAALLTKMSTFNLTEADSETQPSVGGRIAHKKVLWKDMILNLVSIYVPVNADERRDFLKQQMFNHRKIPAGSIIGGDFNCVENPIFDVVKENGGTYQNKHAGLMKTVMRKKQTSDVFYKIHGNRARAYTRETSEIRTRLDRIYAKDTNSQLVWHSHKLDHTYVNYVDSDHIPVVVEAGPLGESKSKKAGKSRINTEILYTQDARREISKIITLAKKNIPSFNPYEGKLRWERIIVRIKEKAYGYTL